MGEGGWLVTHVIPPPEFSTEHLRMDVSAIIGGGGEGGGREAFLFYRLAIQNFNEK